MRSAVRDALKLRTAPPRAPELSERGDLLWIETQYLAPDPNQPRKHFNDESINELADNITQFGLLTPLRVRPMNDGGQHVITDGERRWRAGQLAGVVAFPCLVEAADPTLAFLEAYLANLHRDALTPVDAAVGLQRIRDTFQLAGDDEVARKVNKSVSWVRQMNAVLSLDNASRQTVLEREEPIAVAVGLRQQSPMERQQTLDAIADLPSRDQKVEFIARVNELRRTGQPVQDAITTIKAAKAAADDAPSSNGAPAHSPRTQPATGRPRRLTVPFAWREIGDGIAMLDVAPPALATTRLAGNRLVTANIWIGAVIEDLTAFRDACAATDRSAPDWEDLRGAVLRVFADDSDDAQAIA